MLADGRGQLAEGQLQMIQNDEHKHPSISQLPYKMGGLGTSIRPPLQNAVAKITLIFAGMLGGYAILRAYGLSLSQNLYVLSPPPN